MKDLSKLEQRLAYKFKDQSLFELALTHRSATSDSASTHPNQTNERLEFLGDRVLGLAVAELLYGAYPSEPEGKLALRFAALVSRESLGTVAEKLSLQQYIEKDDHKSQPSSQSIAANACEALVGAIYLDGGFEQAVQVIETLWRPMMEADVTPPKDAKTALQEWAQANGLPLPHYEVSESTGPAHEPHFVMSVTVQGYLPVTGEGPSKRVAAQAAAKKMLDSLA